MRNRYSRFLYLNDSATQACRPFAVPPADARLAPPIALIVRTVLLLVLLFGGSTVTAATFDGRYTGGLIV